MPNEREVINLTKSTQPTENLRKEFRAKLSRVVSRGYVIDRTQVPLPPDVHGEWISDDPVAIAEAQALGFEIDTVHGVGNALHSDATGKAKIGDAIFMTMPKWMKEEIDTLKAEELRRHHGDNKNKPAEETQYAANIAKETPIVNESKKENKELTTMLSD